MIITTQRSMLALAIDALLTALGWVGFFYLFTKGVTSIIKGTYISPGITLFDPLLPSITTLAAYLLVGAINALIIVLWARYHKLSSNDLLHRRTHMQIDDDILASHFRLSTHQLHEIQDSRVTVIYHSIDGAIAHLETDQLHMQPAHHIKHFETSKAA